MVARRRRCRSYHLCAFGGFVLGLLTGLCRPSAIGATTAAVERVVLGHPETQLAELRDIDLCAYAAVSDPRVPIGRDAHSFLLDGFHARTRQQ